MDTISSPHGLILPFVYSVHQTGYRPVGCFPYIGRQFQYYFYVSKSYKNNGQINRDVDHDLHTSPLFAKDLIIIKRDLDLIRRMLLKMESLDSSYGTIRLNTFKDICDDEAVLSLHVHLLLDAGLIEATDMVYTGNGVDDFLITRMTFAGYDYLDSIRSDSVWNEVKKKIASVGDSVSLEIVKELGVTLVKAQLGI